MKSTPYSMRWTLGVFTILLFTLSACGSPALQAPTDTPTPQQDRVALSARGQTLADAQQAVQRNARQEVPGDQQQQEERRKGP